MYFIARLGLCYVFVWIGLTLHSYELVWWVEMYVLLEMSYIHLDGVVKWWQIGEAL